METCFQVETISPISELITNFLHAHIPFLNGITISPNTIYFIHTKQGH